MDFAYRTRCFWQYEDFKEQLIEGLLIPSNCEKAFEPLDIDIEDTSLKVHPYYRKQYGTRKKRGGGDLSIIRSKVPSK